MRSDLHLDEELSELVFATAHPCLPKATAFRSYRMPKLAVKPSCMEKNSWLPIVHLQENNAINVRNCHSQIFTAQENIPEVCALKLGTIDECDQNLQNCSQTSYFSGPSFFLLLDE